MTEIQPSDYTFSYDFSPIRLGEFDIGGVLYHANYFHLLEEIREAYLESINHPYSKFMSDGMHLPLIYSEQKYIAPVKYGNNISARMNILAIGRTKIEFNYMLFVKQDPDAKIHIATTRHACVKEENQELKICRIPPELLASISNNKKVTHE